MSMARSHSSKPPVLEVVLVVAMVVALTPSRLDFVRRKQQLAGYAEAATANQEGKAEEGHEAGKHLHPALFVDTKYWIRNTEFGERDNWRNQLKPCTLIERIQINERAVISMGDALDSLGGSLESNIREISLAREGVLLLEEDTLIDQADPMFVQYLNQSGDCYESPIIIENNENNRRREQLDSSRFYFEPNGDDMSWFNPNNWASALNEHLIADYVPESHLIPCSEDVVVFGSRSASLWPLLEGNERAETLTFKVNFGPSERWLNRQTNNHDKQSTLATTSGLRVSRLQIGDKTYSQQEFDQLIINSDSYRNLLFQVADNQSALELQRKANEMNFNDDDDGQREQQQQFVSPITIDESSIEANSRYDFCLDEAGCLCGNEEANVMQIICSFYDPLEPADLPCTDPIPAAGYCNQLCATILTIHMDPIKFSERYLANVLHKMMDEDELVKVISDNVFTGARRVDHNKYELTFRIAPSEDQSHEQIIGQDLIIAQELRKKLDNAATRSFYGIRSMEIRSSSQWKRSNRDTVFWLSLVVSIPLAMFIYSKRDHSDTATSSSAGLAGSLTDDLNYCIRCIARTWTSRGGDDNFGTLTSSERPILDETDSVVDHAGTIELGAKNLPEIALVELLESKPNSSGPISIMDNNDMIGPTQSCKIISALDVDNNVNHDHKMHQNIL